MEDFPEPLSKTPFDAETLLTTIRAGLAAELELCERFASDPAVAAWLRDRRALRLDPDHPRSREILNNVSGDWAAEIRSRQAAYLSGESFWIWVREWVRAAGRSLHGSEIERDKQEWEAGTGGAPRGSGQEPPSFDSRKFLFVDQMSIYESCFVPPKTKANQKHFEPLCRTLYRLCVWRFLVRRARKPGAPPGKLRLSYSMLAALVDGFGPADETRKNRGRTIGNWLAPSLEKFRETLDRQDIRRLLYDGTEDDPEPPFDGDDEDDPRDDDDNDEEGDGIPA